MNHSPYLLLLPLLILSSCVEDQIIDQDPVDPFAAYTELSWSEEFDAIDTDVWNYDIGTGNDGWGNWEEQYYTSRPENIYTEDGILVIKALDTYYQGSAYTSAKIHTRYKQSFSYGMIDVRMKLTDGQGYWPAVWLLDNNNNWPRTGEIDLMEQLGHAPDEIHGTIHFGNAWNDKGSSGDMYRKPDGNFAEEFHNYQLVWEENYIAWYIDGKKYFEIDEGDVGNYNYPFNDKEFFIIVNLAVGGTWPGSPDSSTEFPETFEVDYIRYFTRG